MQIAQNVIKSHQVAFQEDALRDEVLTKLQSAVTDLKDLSQERALLQGPYLYYCL